MTLAEAKNRDRRKSLYYKNREIIWQTCAVYRWFDDKLTEIRARRRAAILRVSQMMREG